MNAVVLGVSPDSVKSHQKFRAKYALPYNLLVDEEHRLADAYDIWKEKILFGVKYMGVERSTVIIDCDRSRCEDISQGQHRRSRRGSRGGSGEAVGTTQQTDGTMKRIVFATLATVAQFRASAFAQDAPRVSEIATTGRGEVRVTPTRAIVSFTVENFAKNAAQAASDNSRTSQAIRKSLRDAGVAENELTNGGYSVNQDFEKGDRTKPRGFNARNVIRVEVSRVADVGKLIDAALAAGATSVSPIQFTAGDLTTFRRDALKAAVAEARRDAETLAEAAGGSLGRLIAMNGFFNPGIALRAAAEVIATSGSGSYVPTDLRSNDLTVTANASGRWEFIPRR